ncbi:hypothetical protein NE237_030627 [Protea cynaroides]|uniref:Uncharacterized protein n=1 Tax=Protea cynaroides TaxID=273540 RepID=A0A9Q0JX58_9MAGN|nr:hypothetical protein NE237_030627 [Protea cynaroides]
MHKKIVINRKTQASRKPKPVDPPVKAQEAAVEGVSNVDWLKFLKEEGPFDLQVAKTEVFVKCAVEAALDTTDVNCWRGDGGLGANSRRKASSNVKEVNLIARKIPPVDKGNKFVSGSPCAKFTPDWDVTMADFGIDNCRVARAVVTGPACQRCTLGHYLESERPNEVLLVQHYVGDEFGRYGLAFYENTLTGWEDSSMAQKEATAIIKGHNKRVTDLEATSTVLSAQVGEKQGQPELFKADFESANATP